MLRVFLVFLSLFIVRPAWAQDPVILVVGDSLSAGYGIELEQGWVALLQQRLKKSGYSHKVVNASISGDTTSSGLKRLPEALNRLKPAVVIIELGANDGLRGQSIASARDNLAAMIRLGKDAHAKVLLIGIRLPPNFGSLYNRKFEQMYHQLAQQASVLLVPYLLQGVEDRHWMQEDQLHPLPKAQPYIMENVWKVLRGML